MSPSRKIQLQMSQVLNSSSIMYYSAIWVTLPLKEQKEERLLVITQLAIYVWIKMLPFTRSMLLISYGVLKQHSSVPLFTFLNVRKHTYSFFTSTNTISYTLCGEPMNIFLKYSFFLPLLRIFFSPSSFLYQSQSYILTSLSVNTNTLDYSLSTSIICWCLKDILMVISSRWEDLMSKRRAVSLDLRRITVSVSLWMEMMDYEACSSYLLITYPDSREMKPNWLAVDERQNTCLELKQI